MGCCLSKNDPPFTSFPTPIPPNDPKKSSQSIAQVENKKRTSAAWAVPAEMKVEKQEEGEEPANEREVFIRQHSNNDNRPGESSKCPLDSDGSVPHAPISLDPSSYGGNIKPEKNPGIGSSSGKGKGSASGEHGSGSRKHADSGERSVGTETEAKGGVESGVEAHESKGSHGHRRTPGRSRERGRGRGGTRVLSRSPGRRSESSIIFNGNGNGNGRPGTGKPVSVPVPASLSNDKGSGSGSGNGSAGEALALALALATRKSVKRNVGGVTGGSRPRGTASPRSRSPARGGHAPVKFANENNNNNQQRQEDSPHRRTEFSSPRKKLNGIDNDMNSLPFQQQPQAINNSHATPKQKNKDTAIEDEAVVVVAKQQPMNAASQNNCVGTDTAKVAAAAAAAQCHRRTGSRGREEGNEAAHMSCKQPQATQELTEDKGEVEQCKPTGGYNEVATPAIICPADTLRLPQPQSLTRSRSSRRSRDLDIIVDYETLLNPGHVTSNYNSLLLQDIKNFHQNLNNNPNDNTNTSKACSIIEASSTSSNLLSSAFTHVRHRTPLADISNGKEADFCFSANPAAGKKRLLHDKEEEEEEEPVVVESEVNVGDDLMEPSLHKYVTVMTKGMHDEEKESSGSNSCFVGSQLNNWTSTSSADSTSCWVSKTTAATTTTRREDGHLVLERPATSEPIWRNMKQSQRKLASTCT
ncbi:hypothetical protein Dimus_021873 [Dionaea muscipula]